MPLNFQQLLSSLPPDELITEDHMSVLVCHPDHPTPRYDHRLPRPYLRWSVNNTAEVLLILDD